jgi:hypothetical protein
MATMLKSWFVALTDGWTYPRKDIWKGRSKNAPDTPPMDVKKEITNATSGGIQGETSIPAVGNIMVASPAWMEI